MKAGPLIAVIVIVAVVAGAAIFVVVPMLQPKVAVFELTMVDYGFDRPGFGPTLTIKAGQLVRITLTNAGSHPHEFMVVKDKDKALMMMKKMAQNLLEQGITDPKEADERIAMMMEEMDMAYNEIEAEVEPDEMRVIEFTIDEPGTYWYVCQRAGGTFPVLHQEKGMFGKIVVEPA